MDFMSSAERIETAIALGKPDRVPVVPIIDFFASHYGGITQHEMFFDLQKADRALLKTMHELGHMDGQNFSYAGLGRTLMLFFPNPPVMPGVNGVSPDAQFQFVEASLMEPREYTELIERGPRRWMLDKLKINHPSLNNPINLARGLAAIIHDNLKLRRSIKRMRGLGVESLVAYNIVFTPLEFLSIMVRSCNDFTIDLFRHPDDVEAACKALREPLFELGSLLAALSGVKRIFLGGSRTSASFISPRLFEKFALPEWEAACDYFIRRGFTLILHFDGEWTPFFHYLRDLPRGKCVMNLDGTSDIFKAREVLGDRMCIMGDVPATMLKLGEPEEVDEYCRRLIEELGQDGGFILSSGCTIPVDAKPENVAAMLQSVKKYGK